MTAFPFLMNAGVDHYRLSFDANRSKCTLTLNGKKIDLFDKRFKITAPKTPYTCYSIRKEQYNDCVISKKENLSAFIFAYGTYPNTNLVIAFKTPTKDTKGVVELECTKSLKKIGVAEKD